MNKKDPQKGAHAVKYCLMHHLFTPNELETLKQDEKKLIAISLTKMDLHLANNLKQNSI